MNWKMKMAVNCALLLLLTGCWDRAELPEKGFVMGLAIDQTDDGKYLLTTQIFKPAQAVGSKGNEMSFINIKATDTSIAKAIRDIPGHLGRKMQWSHMRIIIIGDQLAKTKGLTDVLDFFYRDHEPRIIAPIMITKGRAADYMQLHPLIENTISQQLLEGQRSSASSNGKTLEMNLLELGKQTKSEVGNALMPYVFINKIDSMTVMSIEGAALIKKEKMIGHLSAEKMEGLQMLINKYKSGMVRIPCGKGAAKKQVETIEVLSLHSSMNADFHKKPPVVHYKIQVQAAMSELTCTGKIETMEQQKAFTTKAEQAIKQKLKSTTDYLKKIKFDGLGLGNEVYRKQPATWKKWKPDWEDIFARTSFEYEVEVNLMSSGTNVDKTVLRKK
ncbi:Ger(x)C family spore germination protein [Paenibacillus rigui]|uniref:Uncharacterized protein n=1 Tax=Paenibacillus rigui TaxID=554312 RepID=A0A229UKA4_9BACL|nr:Ger(x)C family spore germination protein [Paenibacillus rigui]OXM83840.1 hypothetical protein CF651_23290 [Paenibacillus rigui]